ncbi:hypothetical protein GCM10009846_25620 [Agrococcus versicolor]|uniref:Uncharacterized protein n=1 Tax=Agrococcus versicolor TaxID=501482 RepID=A0ABP5MMV5_9MICO
MPEVTLELRRWRRRVARDIAAWLSPLLAHGLLGLLTWAGWVAIGEMEWLAFTWGVIGWVVFGTYTVRRTWRERPEASRV